MTTGVRRALCVVLVAALACEISHAQSDLGTLAAIRSRGHVVCGVGDGPAGYATTNARGVWSGISADFCRALAAAIVGNKEAVKFRPLAAAEQIWALQAGEIDVLARHPGMTPLQDASLGIRLAGALLYEGQGFMVRRSQNIASALELSGARVCLASESGAGHHTIAYFAGLNMPFEPVKFEKWPDAVTAYDGKTCQVLSADLSELALARQRLADPNEHIILPELAAKLPVGPAVRQDDDEWFSVVRWTVYALIAAEELGITSGNVDSAKQSASEDVRRFLGIDVDLGKRLGLSADWTQRIVRQVGNYGELFERNLGQKSSLKLERRLNNLSSNGGLHYAPSFR